MLVNADDDVLDPGRQIGEPKSEQGQRGEKPSHQSAPSLTKDCSERPRQPFVAW